MTTQISKVKAHLEQGKTITPGHALLVYGISRLASCIEDLRNSGMEIDMVLKRDESGKQYGEYRMRQTIKVGSKVQVKAGHGYHLPWWVRKQREANVIGLNADCSLVRFIRGKNLKDIWMMNKELVNAD